MKIVLEPFERQKEESPAVQQLRFAADKALVFQETADIMKQFVAVRHATAQIGFAPEDYISLLCGHFLDTIALCPNPKQAVNDFQVACLDVMANDPVWIQRHINALATRTKEG